MSRVLKMDVPIKFDLENQWLNGEQYSHMLRNMLQYNKTFGFEILGSKTHPKSIYDEPIGKSTSNLRRLSLFCESRQYRLGFWFSKAWNKETLQMVSLSSLQEKNELYYRLAESGASCKLHSGFCYKVSEILSRLRRRGSCLQNACSYFKTSIETRSKFS